MNLNCTLNLGEAIQIGALFFSACAWLWWRSLRVKFYVSRVEDIRRELNACRSMQSLAEEHLKWHYDLMGNALALLDKPPHNQNPEIHKVVNAYRETKKGLLTLTEKGREEEEKVQKLLRQAEDDLRKARWGL